MSNGYTVGFPDSSVGKEFICNAGDTSSIPGLERSTEVIGYELQYSGLENSMGTWWWWYIWIGQVGESREDQGFKFYYMSWAQIETFICVKLVPSW